MGHWGIMRTRARVKGKFIPHHSLLAGLISSDNPARGVVITRKYLMGAPSVGCTFRHAFYDTQMCALLMHNPRWQRWDASPPENVFSISSPFPLRNKTIRCAPTWIPSLVRGLYSNLLAQLPTQPRHHFEPPQPSITTS